MATDTERALSIIQEKVELLTGERANGEKRAVRIAELDTYLKALNDRAATLSKTIASTSQATTDEYWINLKKEHDLISAEIDAAVAESSRLLKQAITEAKASINDVRQTAQAARLEAHSVFQDAQTSITRLRQESNSAFSELAQITETILDIRSDVDGNSAAITTEAGARASGDLAIAGQITTINANIATNTASITSEAVARASADSALSSRIDTISASAGGATAMIDAEATARVNADNALAAQITTVSAQASAQRVFVQSSAPSSTGRIVGDLWYDSGNGLKPYYWSGTVWADNSDNRFTTIAASVTSETAARVSADNAITAQITTLTSTVNGNIASITSEAATRASADTALGSRIDNITAVAGGATAAIDSEATARIAADTALANQITSLTSTVNGNTSAITQEATTRANADSAISATVSSLTSTVNTNKATLDQEAVTRANADSALSASLTSLTSTVNANKASFDTEVATRASADTALSGQITSLTSTVTNNKATLDNEITTRANADAAISSSLSTLTTTVNGNSSSITTLQSSYNGVAIKYGVTGYINGQTGGFVLTGIGKNDGSASYLLEIRANVIIDGNLLVTGSVKNAGLEDYAASNSGLATGIKSSGDVSIKVRKNSRVACFASYSSNTNDSASGAFLKITANGNSISSVPLVVSGKILPLTTLTVYPGSSGTRVQGNGSGDASTYYSYDYQYVAYYYYIGQNGPFPAYATSTVTFPASNAFDNSNSSTWLGSKSGNPWIRYAYSTPVLSGVYKVMGYSSAASGSTQGRAPKAWSLQGSNDGTNWTTLDTRSNQTAWGDQEDRQFTIASPQTFTQFRMVITESVDSAETLVGVVQLSFYLPGTASDSENIVFNAYVETTAAIAGYVSLYVVELSK